MISKLSKSTFIRGIKCEKSLYFYKKNFNLRDSISQSSQFIFDTGKEIGILAQGLFPEGADCTPSNHYRISESVLKTTDFIKKGRKIIYEATFMYNEVLAALDILVKDEEGWKAYEVKSSTSVSDTHIIDAAIQYYTIVNSGIDLIDISIVHINKNYI